MDGYKVKSTESRLAYVYEVINYSGALIVFDRSEYGFSLVFQSFVRVILVFSQRFFLFITVFVCDAQGNDFLF